MGVGIRGTFGVLGLGGPGVADRNPALPIVGKIP